MVKKYEMDESKSWEERYKDLEVHHIEETTELKAKLDSARETTKNLQVRMENFTQQLKDHQEELVAFRKKVNLHWEG